MSIWGFPLIREIMVAGHLRGWKMTVSGFFDESGKFKDHAVVSFGGVVAPAQDFSGKFVQE